MELVTAQSNGGGNFTPAPEGMHRAVCYRFVDLGTHDVEYQGKTKRQRKVLLSWELVDTEDEFEYEGKTIKRPFTIHQRFTWSMHEKGNLRPFLEAWRGRRFKDEDLAAGGFDAQKLVGAPCYMQVMHNEKGDRVYANIASINPLPPQMKEGMPDKPHNQPLYLAMTPPERWDQHAFEDLPERMQEEIKGSPEYEEIFAPKDKPAETDPGVNALDDFEDTIPF